MLTLMVLAQTTGVVRDAVSGEPLGKAKVVVGERQAVTDGEGRFGLDAGVKGEGSVSLVGYRTERLVVKGEGESVEVRLVPEGLSRRDSVEVSEEPFAPQVGASVSERTLTAAEVRNLAGVIANDPLRAVQALPGVAAANDFVATFTVRGAGFRQVGIYLDGVLLNNPLHAVQGQQGSGSLTLLNTDVVEGIALHGGAPPVEFGDRTGAALGMTVREGSEQGTAWRVSTGVAATAVMAEGPWRRGTWLVSARKSYLQYLLQKARAVDSLAFGFFDVQAKGTYRPTGRQQWSLAYYDGVSDLDRSVVRDRLGINAILEGTYHFANVQLGHRWTPREKVLWRNKGAWLRERGDNRNVQLLPLTEAGYGEWIGNSDLVWGNVRAGVSVRRIRDDGYEARYQFNPLSVRRRDDWVARGWRQGGYAQQDWQRGRVAMSVGARWDDASGGPRAAVSPHASVRVGLGPRTQWVGAWSHAVQYPALSWLTVRNTGNAGLPPSRAIHAVTGVERALSGRTRLRVEAFYRADRDLVTQPLLEPRLLADGRVFVPPAVAPYEASVRGVSRGGEVFLQQRSANRWTGWVSYGWARTRMRDGVTGARYDADTDQRHTVNAYSSLRLSSTVNLSVRYGYGSNFPLPGFYTERGGQYFLARERNTARLPAYSRADLRLNKQFDRPRWRGVLYVEVMNVLNRSNRAFDAFNGFHAGTQRVNVSTVELFPVVPAVGWMMDWSRR
jgi:hypothetical protein